MDRRQKRLTSVQMLRKLYMCLSTNNSLTQYASQLDMARIKWMGDGTMLALYMGTMEDLWDDLGTYTEEQKRDQVASQMRESDDQFIKADLAEFYRAGGGLPYGAN